jgi:hypothetical protein
VRFWNRWRSTGVERELEGYRPRAREEFVRDLAGRVQARTTQPGVARLRLALVAALTAAMLVALAAFGGYEYALAGGKDFANAIGSVATSDRGDNNRGRDNDDDDDDGGEDDDDDAADDEYKHKKITICHRTGSSQNPTRTIRIRRSAWPAHQAHGDTMGRCPRGDNDDDDE